MVKKKKKEKEKAHGGNTSQGTEKGRNEQQRHQPNLT